MKRKLLVFLILVIGSLILGNSANAQTAQNYQISTNPDVPQNYHTYTQSVIIELAAALSCQISGIDPINPNAKCLGVDPTTGKIGYVNGGGGLIGITGNSIASMFVIPASSTHYAKYLADNFGIAKNTYAQNEFNTEQTGGGIGFTGLAKLLPIWKVMRNVVYMLFVFIFVIIGVGIMFRIKIDPRTVMTIQNQIPKIIIALILVTFSYAIAGLLVDMMYVFIYLVYNVMSSVNPTLIEGLSPGKIQGSNPLTAVGFIDGLGIAWNASNGLGSIMASLFEGRIGTIIATVVGGIIGAGVGSIGAVGLGTVIGGIIGAGAGILGGSALLGVVGGVIAFLVISVALLTALFRLWFQLIKTYISILINIVLAPFWIAGGLIPTSPISFGGWMRDMIANLSSFPATLFMLLIGKIFIEEFGKSDAPSTFVPPFIGNPGDTKHFGAIIGLGIILLTPSVVNLIRQALKAPQGKTTAMIGQSINAGATVLSSPISKIGGKMWGQDPYSKEYKPLTGFIRRRTGQLGGRLGGGIDSAVRFLVGKSPAEFEASRQRAQDEGQRFANRNRVPPPETPVPDQQTGEGQGDGGGNNPPTNP